jgi:putative tryptophan/tyrosine transport system substrate-binding protein
MRRRAFISLLGAPAAWPLVTTAQQRKLPVIGYLTATSVVPSLLDDFRKGLAEQGYVEGRNVRIEFRAAEGKYDRLSTMAAELIDLRVDVLVTGGGNIAAQAGKAATANVPIVFLVGGDPVAGGLVDSLARPGANITGVAQLTLASEPKRLELLHELVPNASTIAFLQNSNYRQQNVAESVEEAARILGIKLVMVGAGNEPDLLEAIATVLRERAGGLLVSTDPYFFVQRDLMVELSARNRIPTMYFFREFVQAGGLVSYGTNLADGYRHLGIYAGKILGGTKPADLPVTCGRRPGKDILTFVQHWSGAVTCPAC